MTRLEPFNDGVNAVDENLLTAAPNEDTLDDLVDARKPVCRREQELVVAVVFCGA